MGEDDFFCSVGMKETCNSGTGAIIGGNRRASPPMHATMDVRTRLDLEVSKCGEHGLRHLCGGCIVEVVKLGIAERKELALERARVECWTGCSMWAHFVAPGY